MPVDPAARRHFDAVARAMDDENDAERRQALETSALERVATGFRLGAFPLDEAQERALDERTRGQIGLAQRRLALGL